MPELELEAPVLHWQWLRLSSVEYHPWVADAPPVTCSCKSRQRGPRCIARRHAAGTKGELNTTGHRAASGSGRRAWRAPSRHSGCALEVALIFDFLILIQPCVAM
eukprot:scaffold14576_cov132-Isochrysis_galbana.AAC.10